MLYPGIYSRRRKNNYLTIGNTCQAIALASILLGAVWLLAFLGLRYPLQMLPLLMFEFVWKTIWLFDYGLPQWSSGQHPPTFAGDFQAIAVGPVFFAIVIPWGYVYRHYFRRPADRWR